MLLRAAKARALLQGRDHALPDDVQHLAEAVLSHRLVLTPEALDLTGDKVVADAVAATPAMCEPPMRGARDTGLLALALGLAAALFDAEPLWVPAVALALLAGGAIGVGRARLARAARPPHAQRAAGMEDEPLEVTLDIRAGTLPLPTGRLVDPLLDAPVALATGRRRSRIRIDARFSRRGRRTLEAPKIVVSDPLSLATRTVQLPPETGDDEVLVLPRIERVQAPRDGDDNRAALARAPRRRPPRSTWTGCARCARARPPRASTGPRSRAARSRWSASSRGRATARPLIVLDPRGASEPEDLDAAVRAAASLTVHLARTGGCSLLLPGDKRPTAVDPTLSGWPHLHARLAVVPDNGRPLLAGLTGRRGDVIYVSARIRSTPPAGVGTAAGARMLVVPRGLAGRRAAFSVAGCHGYALERSRASRRPTVGAGSP